MADGSGAGVTINPVAFLVITKENVRLIPVNHASSIDRLLDYMPDLIEKTNNMMNRCIQNKKEETEKIINQMAKKNKKQNSQQNNTHQNGMKHKENKEENIIDELEKSEKKVQKLKDEAPEEITYEFEYDEVQDEDDEI